VATQLDGDPDAYLVRGDVALPAVADCSRPATLIPGRRLQDGKVIEHWSVRDDLGQALQLGLIGP
jgi:hypothetical protein